MILYVRVAITHLYFNERTMATLLFCLKRPETAKIKKNVHQKQICGKHSSLIPWLIQFATGVLVTQKVSVVGETQSPISWADVRHSVCLCYRQRARSDVYHPQQHPGHMYDSLSVSATDSGHRLTYTIPSNTQGTCTTLCIFATDSVLCLFLLQTALYVSFCYILRYLSLSATDSVLCLFLLQTAFSVSFCYRQCSLSLSATDSGHGLTYTPCNIPSNIQATCILFFI